MAHKGFTAVETLLTLGIIAITAGVSVPLYRTYQLRSDLDTAVEQAKHALERAQVLARAGQNDSMWGYAAGEGVLFQGEAFAIREPQSDELYIVPGSVKVSGMAEVVFQRVSGEPLTTGKIVYEAGNGEQRTITVTTEGTLTLSPLLPPVEQTSSSAASGDMASSVPGSSAASAVQSQSSAGVSTGSTGSAGSSDSEDTQGGAESSSSAATCEDTFALLPDGTVQTTGTVDAAVKVLGSQVSEGAGGGSAKVVVSVSTDEGDTWVPLFNGKAVKGGEEETVQNLPSGTKLLVRVNGRHSWLFNRTFQSNNAEGHMFILKNGHLVPSATYDAFGNIISLAPFLRNVIENGRVKIHPHAILFLTELDALWKGSSKFQDAVIQVTFTAKPGSCAQTNDPKVKIVFDRLENQGAGDLQRRVYVGEQGILFAENQWIPLSVAGVVMTDDALVEDVPGMAMERRSGVLRVLLHGSHIIPSGKELADARIIFDRAQITSVEADSGQNAPEAITDGIVNDGAGGDEVTIAPDRRSLLFQTRVTTADDAIYIHWSVASVASSSVASGASSSAASSQASSASSQEGEEGQTGSESSLPADACAAAYMTDDRGRIVLGEEADVSFTVLGSYATYGANGPMIHVRLNASLDGGSTWRGLFNFRDILGGDTQTFRDVPAGSAISLSAEGRYSWLFKRVANVVDQTDRVKFLRPGAVLPGIGLLKTPSQLRAFLRERITDGHVSLGRRQILALVELQDLDDTADFQDAVLLISISKPASGGGICGSASSSSVSSGFSSSGTSTASSSSAGEEIIICHFLAQDRGHPQTLVIGVSAWSAHEAHGDRRGACEADDDGDGISNAQDFCPGTYTPESVPTEFMLFNRYALMGTTGIFREGPRKIVSSFSLSDTRGCSCEQLVDVAEGVREYYFTSEPLLLRELKSLFPFYTNGARQFGCGSAILRMARP
ncbi:MAG: hypothetical protein PHX87_00165 [Candidatus Peribacteraceae bacterium]|nr:hypothetical protein [Candidatus Peribacteraceae bacterium]MDD5741822.1 hypothetical protein [Candidatus Peribacteraceae bacterium]